MDLSFNQIEDIDPSAFKEIPEDSALSLDLSHNSISYLTVVMFDELDNFRVNLAENKIRFELEIIDDFTKNYETNYDIPL